MADDVLSRALGQLSGEIAQTDPYSRFGSLASDIGGLAVKSADMDSLGEAAAISFLGGLLGQGLGDLGRDYRQERALEAENILRRRELGLAAPSRDLLSERLYKRALDYGDLARASRARSILDEQRKLQQALGLDIAKTRAGKEIGLEFAGEEERAKVLGKERALAELEKLFGARDAKDVGGEAALPRGEAEPIGVEQPGLLTSVGKEKFARREKALDREEKMFKEFKADAEPYLYQLEGLRAMREAFADKSGTSDFELIRRAAQAVEPGLAVRRDDSESLERAASVLGQVGAQAKGALFGETRLTEDVRRGLLRIGQRKFDQTSKRYDKVRSAYKRKAERIGLPVEDIIIYDPAVTAAEVLEGLDVSAQPAAPVADVPAFSRAELLAEAKRRGLVD